MDLNREYPDYEAYIESSAVEFSENLKSPARYNHVSFNCVKDQNTFKIWITMKLTYKELEDESDDSDDEEEVEKEPINESEYTDSI